MEHLKAIIFDVDGTLADTEDTHRQAFNRAFAEFGLDWNWTPKLYEELLVISGGRERIAYYGADDLKTRFKGHDDFVRYVRELHELKTHLYAQMLNTVTLRPGVARLLAEARSAGLRLGIATSTAFSNVKTLLDHNLPSDWMSWFTTIKTCDTVVAKKPSPAVYLAVLEGLKLPPEACVAIEDTQNGLRSASAAGLATVITTHFFTRHHHFPNAALVIDGVGDPENPFTVQSGDSRGRQYVDLGLLEQILAERELYRAAQTWEHVQVAVA